MKFNWTPEEKERYYRRAEKLLKDADIDFISVDRSGITVAGWNPETKEVKAVYVSLTPYPYRKFSNVRKSQLMKLGNWQQTNSRSKRLPTGKMTETETFMRSRLEFRETRGRKKKECRKEPEVRKTGCTLSDGPETSRSRTE